MFESELEEVWLDVTVEGVDFTVVYGSNQWAFDWWLPENLDDTYALALLYEEHDIEDVWSKIYVQIIEDIIQRAVEAIAEASGDNDDE